MSNFGSPPGDVLDRALANHHRKLVSDITATLDLEAGLREAPISAHYADFVADLAWSLDFDAGLAAILPVGPEVRRPLTLGPAAAEHVASSKPGQAHAGQPELDTIPVVTASELRANIYRLLDQVLETGVPLEIERKGRRLRIVAEEPTSKLARLVPHPGYIVGDPEALVDTDWSGYWDAGPL